MHFTSLKGITAKLALEFQKIGLIIGIFFVLLVGFGNVLPASTQSLLGSGGDPLGVSYQSGTGLSNTDPRITVARILRLAMGFLGVIFFAIVIFGGYEWMTAAGNDEKISKAKKRIYSGAIGLLVILSSYSISYFIIRNLVNATTGGASTSF